MNYRLWVLASIVLVATAVWSLFPLQRKPVQPEDANGAASASAPRPSLRSVGSPGASRAAPRLAAARSAAAKPGPPEPIHPAAASQLPAAPDPSTGVSPVVALENVRSLFRQYHQRFGGNPVGTNEEITRALNGGNPKQVVFLNPDDGLRLNERGELIDSWGSPYFFHQLSGSETEIHSAGPDRRMWTADDLVLK